MKLLLIRHGETLQNKNAIIQGQQQGDLSPTGIQQAALLCKRLNILPLSRIYCSDLKRTRDTISPHLKYQKREERSSDKINSKRLTSEEYVTYTPEIRERNFGELEGKSGKEYFSILKETGLSRAQYRPPGGENFYDLRERIDRFLENVIFPLNKNDSSPEALPIALISHGGTIRSLLSSLLNIPIEELLKHKITNTSISTVILNADNTYKSYDLNDITHLRSLEEPDPLSLGIDALCESTKI